MIPKIPKMPSMPKMPAFPKNIMPGGGTVHQRVRSGIELARAKVAAAKKKYGI